VSNIGNPNLKWETVWTTNVGTDFSMFNNRLYGSVDVYKKLTKDLFVQKQLTAEAGGYITTINAGKLGNKGVEVDLGYDLVKNKNVTWTLKGNFGYNKNEVISIAGEQPYTLGTSRITEGLPLGAHYEVAWAGVDQATGAPLYYKKDGTLTTIYSADDKVQNFGTWEAPWKGGFGSNVRYGNLELSLLFTFQQGATKTDNLEYFVENPIGFLSGGYNQSSSLHFWTRPGDVATTPSPLFATNFSSKLIHDASFLRFRDITISYTVPNDQLKRSKFISRARFFVQGSNLFIWTKWRGMDPEAGPTNINLSEFPNPRAITGGLNITF
jgi:outer membrane receptor protein involved in Fe transport